MSVPNADPKGSKDEKINKPITDVTDESADDGAAELNGSEERVNDRILKESKKYKERLSAERARTAELQSQLEDIKRAELEKQGKEKERADYYKDQYDTLRQQLVKKNVDDAVTALASKMGCSKPKAVLQLGNKTLLQYDDSTNEVLGVESFVEDVKREYPEFFSKEKRSVVNSSLPSTKVEDHSQKDKDRVAKAIKGSQKEFADMLKGSSLMSAKK